MVGGAHAKKEKQTAWRKKATTTEKSVTQRKKKWFDAVKKQITEKKQVHKCVKIAGILCGVCATDEPNQTKMRTTDNNCRVWGEICKWKNCDRDSRRRPKIWVIDPKKKWQKQKWNTPVTVESSSPAISLRCEASAAHILPSGCAKKSVSRKSCEHRSTNKTVWTVATKKIWVQPESNYLKGKQWSEVRGFKCGVNCWSCFFLVRKTGAALEQAVHQRFIS